MWKECAQFQGSLIVRKLSCMKTGPKKNKKITTYGVLIFSDSTVDCFHGTYDERTDASGRIGVMWSKS